MKAPKTALAAALALFLAAAASPQRPADETGSVPEEAADTAGESGPPESQTTAAAAAYQQQSLQPAEDLIPESPRAWRIRRAASPAPSLLTGAAEFEIPLFTVEARGLSLPFSLRYVSNGIRVDDDPFPCGYGWSLLPALRVQRRINGRPDEHFPHHSGKRALTPYELAYKCVSDSGASSPGDTRPDLRWDPEHDIFTVLLPGRTLTLVYDGGAFRGAACGEYRVEGNDGLENIFVTDPAGYVWDFGGGAGECARNGLFRTEWLLQTVTAPSGDVVASFEWQPNAGHSRGAAMPANRTVWYSVTQENGQFHGCSDPGNRTTPVFTGMCELTRVTTDAQTAVFEYGKDVAGRLQMLTRARLSAGGEAGPSVSMSYMAGSGRLLEKVTHSADGVYTFDYDRQALGAFPGECGQANPSEDWWGFYNGRKCQDSYTWLSPSLTLTLPANAGGEWRRVSVTVKGADRRVDTAAMQAKTLKKAVLPTGAVMEWEYEPHRFAQKTSRHDCFGAFTDNTLSEGGGIRVRRATLRDPGGAFEPETREYIYGKNGSGLAECPEAPLLSTFVEGSRHVGYYETNTYPLNTTFVDETGIYEILSRSNYMDGRPGETPLWYSEVAELHAEGKTVSSFAYLCGANEVDYDSRVPVPAVNRTSLSGGPQLVRRETYRSAGAAYERCVTEAFEYETADAGTLNELRVQRLKFQTQVETTAPDFGLGATFTFDGGSPYVTQLRTAGGPGTHNNAYTALDDVYRTHSYELRLLAERLRKKSVTLHTPDGDMTRSESYSYVDGTSLVRRTDFSTSDGKAHFEETEYIPAGAAGDKMRAFNITGVPTKTTLAYGAARTVSSTAMYHKGERMVLPASSTHSRDGRSLTAATYRHDMYGNLAEISRADGTVTSYIWGHGGLYPVWRVDGKKRSALDAAYGGGIESGDGDRISPAALRSRTVAVSGAEWKPGVGVSALTGRDGVRSTFAYDSGWRPASAAVDGLGTVSTTAYIVGVEGRTYTDERVWLNAAGTSRLRTVTNCDSRGRVSSVVSETADGGRAASLVTYDAMGRRSAEWRLAPVSGAHPSAAEVKSAAAAFHGDPFPYKKTEYEASPRALPVSSVREGAAWHGGDRAARTSVTTNIAKSTRYNDNACPRFEAAPDGVEYMGLYDGGTLLVEETADEDGVTLQTFTDSRGLKVMERRGPRGSRLSTRFVYDDHGQLRYILPPPVGNASAKRTDPALERYAFWYDYDFAGNVTLSRTPGCGAVIHRRDPAGREAATRDCDSSPGWRLHLYDALGREVVTAYAEWTEAQLSAFLAAPRRMAPSSAAGAIGGYVCEGYAMPAVKRVLLSRHYDSLGRLTKEDAGDIATEYAYDNLGRVSSRTDRYPGHTVKRAYTYSYTGNALTCRTEYTGAGVPAATTLSLAYDSADRPVSASVSRSGSAKAAVTTAYDAVGRPVSSGLGAVTRDVSYDVHGWVESLSTKASGARAASVAADTAGAPFRAATAAAAAGRTLREETVEYAGGSAPRYNGGVSARTFPGGRYDYSYDVHDRLTRAAYTSDGGAGESYTCVYGYDSNSNVTSLSRNGRVNIAGTERVYGLHDYFYYFYEGNRLKSLGGGANGADYEGRTGLGANFNGAIGYDSGGRVVRDETRGIELIEYNVLGLPERITLSSGEKVVNAYDGRGVKHSTMLLDAAGRTVTKRQYIGDAIIDDGKLTMQLFEGGYLDAAGNAHYYITDWQGNITAVADASGNLVQSAEYYPDGEPWEEPQGDNRFLFAGKERLGIGGLNMYDFGPRMYNAAGCFWYQPDPAAACYPHISPYSYCAGNPVRFVDPSGQIIEYAGADTKFIRELISELREDKMFDEVFSMIDASKDTYTIGLGRIIIPGTNKEGSACFNTNTNTITFSKELMGKKGLTTLSVCEELYHVYQKIVPTPENLVNEEYEAKTFAVIENNLIEYSGNPTDDLNSINAAILNSFMDADGRKFVYNSSFPQCYVENGVEFLKYHKSNPVAAYRIPVLFMPQRLINLLTR